LRPTSIVKSVDAAVSFYKRAFGAEEILRLSMPDGTVVHCELKFGDSRVNLGESMEGWPEHSLLAQIFVADSDAVFAQAVKAGATALSPMTEILLAHGKGVYSIPSAAHGRFRRTSRAVGFQPNSMHHQNYDGQASKRYWGLFLTLSG
jgi:uncharacterized glyoxalase superfamily protein PhnB